MIVLFNAVMLLIQVVALWYVAVYHVRTVTPVVESQAHCPAVQAEPAVLVSRAGQTETSIPIGDASALHLSMTSGNALEIGAGSASYDFVVDGSSVAALLEMHRRYQDIFCADVPCVHGQSMYLTDCACVCAPGWTGAACDEHTCYDHGVWDVQLQTCSCASGFTSASFCRLINCSGLMATECSVDSNDVNCTILAACDSTCAGPNACPVRSNWGVAVAPTSAHPFGLCPGGFRKSGDTLYIETVVMSCYPSEHEDNCTDRWVLEAPVCCSPTGDCGRVLCSTQPTCCAQFTSGDECVQRGCAWCSNAVCMSPDIAMLDLDCVHNVGVHPTGVWQHFVHACSDATCHPNVVDRYFALWATGGYAAVVDAAWPELGASALGIYRRVSIRIRALGWLSFAGETAIVDAAPTWFMIGYPTASTQLTDWQRGGSAAHLYFVGRDHRMWCMATSRMDPFERIQLYGYSNTSLPLLAAISIDRAEYCGLYILQNNTQFADETGALFLAYINTELQWSAEGNLIDLYTI